MGWLCQQSQGRKQSKTYKPVTINISNLLSTEYTILYGIIHSGTAIIYLKNTGPERKQLKDTFISSKTKVLRYKRYAIIFGTSQISQSQNQQQSIEDDAVVHVYRTRLPLE